MPQEKKQNYISTTKVSNNRFKTRTRTKTNYPKSNSTENDLVVKPTIFEIELNLDYPKILNNVKYLEGELVAVFDDEDIDINVDINGDLIIKEEKYYLNEQGELIYKYE